MCFIIDNNGQVQEVEFNNEGSPRRENDLLYQSISRLNELEYIGKFTGTADSYLGNDNADMYRVSENCILQVWEVPDWSAQVIHEERLKNKYGIEHYYEGALFMAED